MSNTHHFSRKCPLIREHGDPWPRIRKMENEYSYEAVQTPNPPCSCAYTDPSTGVTLQEWVSDCTVKGNVPKVDRQTFLLELFSSLPPTTSRLLNSSVSYIDLTHRIVRHNIDPATHGGYANIHKCTLDRGTNNIKIAVKIPRYTDDLSKQSKMLCHEMNIWASLYHENILPFYGIAYGFGLLPAMVSPWAHHGTLNDYLAHNPNLRMPQRLQLLLDIASGLHYLHSRMIVHGDLSGANILIDDNGNAYISDFGLSIVSQETPCTTFSPTSFGANLRWTAPELLQVPDHGGAPIFICSKRTDIYSFGSVMLQVLSGKISFSDLTTTELYLRVVVGCRPPRENGWNGESIPDIFWDFICRCWDVPVQRPSSSETLTFMHSLIHDL